MSAGLIIAVGLIYLAVAVEQLYKGDMGIGLMYIGYAFANVGAWILVTR